MMKGAYLLLKDKKFFSAGKVQRVLGPALQVAKNLHAKDIKVLHISDLDLNRGIRENNDVYDNLSYFIHTQVEIPSPEYVEMFKSINIRTVALPWLYDPSAEFSAVMVKKGYEKWIPYFKDIVSEDRTIIKKAVKEGKRVFAISSEEKGVFCSLTKRISGLL